MSDALEQYNRQALIAYMGVMQDLVVRGVALTDSMEVPPDVRFMIHSRALQIAQMFMPDQPTSEPPLQPKTVKEALNDTRRQGLHADTRRKT